MEQVSPDISISELFTQQMPRAKERGPAASGEPVVYSGFDGKVLMPVFSGTLSMANAERLGPILGELLTSDAEQIILSFAGVTKLSHTAVGILVSFAGSAFGRGKELYLYEPSATIKQRLVDLNVDAFFKILQTEDDLFDALLWKEAGQKEAQRKRARRTGSSTWPTT